MKPVGLVDGRLRACPPSPNCVCSQESDAAHRVEPWPFSGDADSARARLLATLEAFPRVRIVTAEPRYLHATFTTAIFGWVDDVEMLVDEQSGAVQVRSASRTGYSDLGANKRRVARLRAAFEASA